MATYSVGRTFFVRSCGLPAQVLDRLTKSGSWSLAEKISDLDEKLAADADELGAVLFELIGDPAHASLKPRLVALRRCVHGRRPPARGEWSDELARSLPPGPAGQVREWLDRLHERAATMRALDEATGRDALAEAQQLAAVAADPLFGRALAQASPALFEAAGKGLARHRRRRLVTGLTKFVSRAAAKTSPYSTFMTTAPGEWTASGPPLSASGDDGVRCVPEIDRMVLEQLIDALSRDPGLGGEPRIKVNTSLRERDGRYVFLGRRPAEPLVSIPASPQVTACLDAVGDGTTATRLQQRLGGHDPRAVAAFCGRLIDLGALEHESPVADQSDTPLDDLADRLPASEPLGELVRSLSRELRDAAGASAVADFRARRAAAVGRLAAVGERLKLDWPEPEVLGKFAVHENAVRPHLRLTAALPAWRPVLDDLDVLRRWLTLHDRMLPVRLALAGYLDRRFDGHAVPFLDLHAAVQVDLARAAAACPGWLLALRPFLQLSDPVPGEALERSTVPALALLHRLRGHSVRTALSGEPRAGVVRTAPRVLADLVSGWPKWLPPREAVSCYVQPFTGPDGELRAVVNTVGGGFGKGRGRWSRLVAQAGGGLPEHTDEYDDVAELSGTFGASVNVRHPVAPFEIDYPFTASSRPRDERIPLTDLMVRLAPGGMLPELFSAARARRVRPAHLGMLADPLLPPAARLLMAGFGQSYLLHPSLSPLKTDEPHGRRPRVEVGRVVVQRAEWTAPAGRVPAQTPAESDAEHLVRLHAWLRAEGIPRRCFVRLRPASGDWVSKVFAKSRKPMFLDFSSMSMVSVFKSMTRGFDGVVAFEEALPDPGADPAGTLDGRVTELVVEITSCG